MDKNIDIKQKSEEWHYQRAGKITSSNASKFLLKTGKLTDGARTYCYKVAGERLSGIYDYIPNVRAMNIGNYYEKNLFNICKKATGIDFKEAFFTKLNDYIGGSPDGISDEYVLELKTIQSLGKFYKMKLDLKKQKEEYHNQLLSNMLVTGKKKGILFCAYIQEDDNNEPILFAKNKDKQYFYKTVEMTKEFEELFYNSTDTCIEEIKRIEELNKKYKNQ